jgi:hypothetical protein
MRKINQHPLRLHPSDHIAAERREAALSQPVSRASHLVVEEMSGRHHSKACVKERIDVLKLAVESMCSFDSQDSSNDSLLALTPVEKVVEIAGGLENGQLAIRAVRHLLQTRGLVDGALL